MTGIYLQTPEGEVKSLSASYQWDAEVQPVTGYWRRKGVTRCRSGHRHVWGETDYPDTIEVQHIPCDVLEHGTDCQGAQIFVCRKCGDNQVPPGSIETRQIGGQSRGEIKLVLYWPLEWPLPLHDTELTVRAGTRRIPVALTTFSVQSTSIMNLTLAITGPETSP